MNKIIGMLLALSLTFSSAIVSAQNDERDGPRIDPAITTALSLGTALAASSFALHLASAGTVREYNAHVAECGTSRCSLELLDSLEERFGRQRRALTTTSLFAASLYTGAIVAGIYDAAYNRRQRRRAREVVSLTVSPVYLDRGTGAMLQLRW